MRIRRRLIFTSLFALVPLLPVGSAPACCPAPPSGKPVVNADQTVVIVWDPATRTQHFVRRASFKGEGNDFGFLVPTPTRPELEEAGDAAFPILAEVTAPKVKVVARPTGGGGCGCSAMPSAGETTKAAGVAVLEEKVVAGFKASVLDATTAEDLAAWLKENGYAFSPAVQAWARPYVEQGWKITAMKVAKPDLAIAPATTPAGAGSAVRDVSAAALRMSFKTDRPLFPYREPDPAGPARAVGASRRLLRIYFLSDARYQGELTPQQRWSGQTAWAGPLPAGPRERAFAELKLPKVDPAGSWYLTEFEDAWPYRAAPADVYFAQAADQSPIEREPILRYAAAGPIGAGETLPYIVVVGLFGAMPLMRRFSRGQR